MSKLLNGAALGIWTYLTIGYIAGFVEPTQANSAMMAGFLGMLTLIGLFKND